MFKKIVFILILFLFVTSCANTFDSVKRGITGAKKNSSDEFLVKKKDPLVLPPDFENLPAPGDVSEDEEVLSIFEKNLENMTEEDAAFKGDVEGSILRKIQSK